MILPSKLSSPISICPIRRFPLCANTACNLGKLSPSVIHCGSGARKSREEYLTDIDYSHTGGIAGSGSSGGALSAVAGSSFSIAGGLSAVVMDEERRAMLENGRDCGSPTRIEDALVYR